MKHRRTIVIVLLNVLFCAVLLYFFVNNSYLRPWAGSVTNEVLAGLLLLATVYANYYLISRYYIKSIRLSIGWWWFSFPLWQD